MKQKVDIARSNNPEKFYSFIRSFNKYLLSPSSVPDIVLDIRDPMKE